MGACGCGDFRGDFKFKGPGNITYVLQVYQSCEYCDTPAGIILYAMNPDDCEDWNVEHLPEVEISDIGTFISVIHPKELRKQVQNIGIDIECLESDFDSAFREAVFKSIKDNKRLYRDG